MFYRHLVFLVADFFTMKTVLNYSGPLTYNRRGTVLGKASASIAILVIAMPFALALVGMAIQRYLSAPHKLSNQIPTSLLLMIIPAAAMIILPAMGLLLGAMGVKLGKRECQYAVAGMLVNAAALLAAVLVLLT